MAHFDAPHDGLEFRAVADDNIETRASGMDRACHTENGSGTLITLVVPSRNRAHTLRKVAASYYRQDQVDEIVFVDDAGTDDTAAAVQAIASEFPSVRTVVVRNESRMGASLSRNRGVQRSTNDYVLFCDDDEYLEPGYARICREKLLALQAGAVSGRRIYLQPGETQEEAKRRFGHGLRKTAPFSPILCEYVNGARFDGDLSLPFTNAIILTRRSLLEKYPFDDFYARANGYREETDYQMNLFVNGHSIYVTNECHSFHLPISEVTTGGQRVSKLRRVYWSVYFTRYFYGKYYARYARRMKLKTPRPLAVAAFAVFAVYRETLRPPLYWMAMQLLRRRIVDF